jgi:UDP-glucose 4-epimerase
MKLLVTGANGFIGRHLVSKLSLTHDIFALVRNRQQDVPAGVSVIEMDLGRALDPGRLPPKIDVIIHLAQANAPFPEDANELLAVNTGSTQQLLDYGRRSGVRRFILASTGDVYGRHVGASSETDPVDAASFYAVTKRAAEMLTQTYSGYLETCILRLFHPYGSDQAERLIPRLAHSIQEQKPIRLKKDDRPHLSPIHIDDVVMAFEQAVNSSWSGIVNVAGDRVFSVRELAEEIGKVLETEPCFESDDHESADLAGDNALMKEVLGAWPMVALSNGLRRTFKSEEARGCQTHF